MTSLDMIIRLHKTITQRQFTAANESGEPSERHSLRLQVLAEDVNQTPENGVSYSYHSTARRRLAPE